MISREGEKMAILLNWHKRHDQIYRVYMFPPMKDGTLDNLKFSNVDECIDCMKGEITKRYN